MQYGYWSRITVGLIHARFKNQFMLNRFENTLKKLFFKMYSKCGESHRLIFQKSVGTIKKKIFTLNTKCRMGAYRFLSKFYKPSCSPCRCLVFSRLKKHLVRVVLRSLSVSFIVWNLIRRILINTSVTFRTKLKILTSVV